MISRLAADLTRHPAVAGAVLSLLSLPVHLVLPEDTSNQFAAVILGLVAGIYAGFALQDGRARILAIEGLAALAFHWSATRRRKIGATIVEMGFLSADVLEAEARAFHDDLEVVEPG